MSKTSLRSVALPSEHGGWSLTLEPIVLGLLVAPTGSGFALGAAALLAFVARTPVKAVLVDRWRGHRRQRAGPAAAVAAVEIAALIAMGVVAVVTADRSFWWPLAIAAPLIGVELWYDMRSHSRRLVPELAGVVGIGSVAAAIALAGGEADGVATGLWLVIGARSVAAVALIRVQVRRLKGQAHRLWTSDLGQAAAVLLALAAWATDVTPLAGVAVIWAVAIFGVVSVRFAPVATPVLGTTQIGAGLIVVLVTALAVRAW